MRIEPNIAPVASLFGEPSRAAILTVLLDGRSLPAGELARIAGLTPTAASGHLAKLMAGKLVAMQCSGRHRYHRLAGAQVAAVIEALAQLTARPAVLARPLLSPAAQALRRARSCYNHLAGELAVEIAQALEDRGYLRRGEGRRYELGGGRARRWFTEQGSICRRCAPAAAGWPGNAWTGPSVVRISRVHWAWRCFAAGASGAGSSGGPTSPDSSS